MLVNKNIQMKCSSFCAVRVFVYISCNCCSHKNVIMSLSSNISSEFAQKESVEQDEIYKPAKYSYSLYLYTRKAGKYDYWFHLPKWFRLVDFTFKLFGCKSLLWPFSLIN